MPTTAFTTDDRQRVLVEQRLEDIGYEAGVASSADQRLASEVSLTTAIHDALGPVAQTFSLAAAGRPDELRVEFAIRLHHEDGAVISIDGAASHFKVTCVWAGESLTDRSSGRARPALEPRRDVGP